MEKKQIEKRVIDIISRIDQIEEDLRNIPKWEKSAQEFTWGADFVGVMKPCLPCNTMYQLW